MALSWRTRCVALLTMALGLSGTSGCGSDEALHDETRDIIEDFLSDDDIETPPEQPLFVNTGFIPDGARDDQIAALERSNWYRYHSGVPQLDMLPQINDACQSHCDYYVTHIDQYRSTGLSPHNQNSQWTEGFSGVAPWDRMRFFGYNDGASEVIAFEHNAVNAVDGWMNTLYHRIPFMDATLTACGYGAAGSGNWANSSRIDTMDFGWTDAKNQKYAGPIIEALYPPPGSTGIPSSFNGMESPQPPPPSNGYPSGTIVTVTWSQGTNFVVEEHQIWKDGDYTGLPHTWLDAYNDNNLKGANTIALYSDDPLEKGTRYWVRIKGKRNGKEWEREWDFVTERY
jgi:hypothetical protein